MFEIPVLTLPQTILVGYLLGINAVSFFVYGLDKLYARGRAWRITERTLLMLALLGGTLGALAGIKLFRHKTRKSTFLVWVGLIMIIQVGAILTYFSYFHPPTLTLDQNINPLLY